MYYNTAVYKYHYRFIDSSFVHFCENEAVHRHIIAESRSRVTKTAESTRIAGILATPRVSRNDVLYLPEQLAKNHGRTVPVDLEHNHDHTIGTAKLIWNAELQRLEYVGEINDADLEQKLKDGQEYHTSLEGNCQSAEICGEKNCYNACVAGTTIERMALVLEPGIPESSVTVMEKSSLEPKCACKSKLTEVQAETKEMEQCPEGQVWDAEAGKCVVAKAEAKTSEAPAIQQEELKSMLAWFRARRTEESAQAPAIDPDSTPGKRANEAVQQAAYKAAEKRGDSTVGKYELEAIINPVIEQLKAVNRELAEKGKQKMQPVAEVAPKSIVRENYAKFQEFWNNKAQPSMVWEVDKSQWLREHDYDARTGKFIINKSVKETITAANVPAITFQNRIILDPSDLTRYSVRQHVNLQEAGPGTDLVNWYTGDAGNAGFENQTVGTSFTDRTVTISRVQAQLTKRVMGVKVGYYDAHDIPGGVLGFVNEVIGLRAIDDENSFIVGSGTGGFSEAGFTPSNWVRGDTGAAITTENLANVTLKRDGIVAAKRLIAAQGFDTSPGAQVAILSPQAYHELLLDTNLNNYYQYARPEITRDAVLEMIYGAEIAVSTAISFNDQTNDMWRNVVLTKGITSGLGVQSGGGLEFEADRRNDVAQIFVSGRHRAVGARLLENSGCRISTTKS